MATLNSSVVKKLRSALVWTTRSEFVHTSLNREEWVKFIDKLSPDVRKTDIRIVKLFVGCWAF